jgi:hypothetical protein
MSVYYLNGSNQGGQTVTGVGQVVPEVGKATGSLSNPPYQTFQAVVTGTGTVSGSVTIQGSNDGINWTNIGSALAVASGTAPQNASVVTNTTYQYFQANVTALTGTGAGCTVTMGV